MKIGGCWTDFYFGFTMQTTWKRGTSVVNKCRHAGLLTISPNIHRAPWTARNNLGYRYSQGRPVARPPLLALRVTVSTSCKQTKLSQHYRARCTGSARTNGREHVKNIPTKRLPTLKRIYGTVRPISGAGRTRFLKDFDMIAAACCLPIDRRSSTSGPAASRLHGQLGTPVSRVCQRPQVRWDSSPQPRMGR